MSNIGQQKQTKAVLFDFMGTCLDWHSTIVSALPNEIANEEKSNFALNWRQKYFEANVARQARGQGPEDIDITHRRVLLEMLAHPKYSHIKSVFTDVIIDNLIIAWRRQKAWPDVAPALKKLKEKGYEIFVHANGTTRLQLDLVKFAGLDFDMLFSSQLLGIYKPAPENYLKCLDLIQLSPDECITVAAHAYDNRGAKAVGMKTVYIHRWTDDILEDQNVVRSENDAYLNNMDQLVETIESL